MKVRKNGFTLIELLVVIAIIAILAAILFPVFTTARRKAEQQSCVSNLKQISTAVMMYVDDNKGRLPAFTYSEQWRQLDENNIVRYVKSDAVFHCPSADAMTSGQNPPRNASENWKNWFRHDFTVGGTTVTKYTDYKMFDNQYLLGKPVDSVVRSNVWVVVVIDAADWLPRHPRGDASKNYLDGGNNLGFLDGHVKYFKKAEYNDQVKRSGSDHDDAGATPFWNWGLDRDLWQPE